MGLKDRLVLITKELGLSGRAFEKECGLTTGAFAGFGDRVGADVLSKISIRYPQFSTRWILTGEGEMLVKNEGNFAFVEKILEKFSDVVDAHKDEHNIIIGQNGKIVEQNGAIVKQNSEILSQNAEVIKQNSELMRQNAEAMAIIQKLSEKLK